MLPDSENQFSMTPEERRAAWQRCEELRRELESLLTGQAGPGQWACDSTRLRAELDDVEDCLAADLIEQDTTS